MVYIPEVKGGTEPPDHGDKLFYPMGTAGGSGSNRTRFDPGGVNIPSSDPDPTSGDGGSSTPDAGLNIPTFGGTDRAGDSGRETVGIGMDPDNLPDNVPLVGGDGANDEGPPLGLLAVIGAVVFAVIALLEG